MKKKNLFLSVFVVFILFTIVSSCNKEEDHLIQKEPFDNTTNEINALLTNQVIDLKEGDSNEALQEVESFMARYTANSFGDDDKAKIPVKLLGYKSNKSRLFINDSLEQKTYSFLAVTDYVKEDRIYNVILTKHKNKWGDPQLMEYKISGFFDNGHPILTALARYKLKGWKVTGDRSCDDTPCNPETSIGGSGGGGTTGGTSTGGGGSGTGSTSGGGGGSGTGATSGGGDPIIGCSYWEDAMYRWYKCGGFIWFYDKYAFTDDCCEPISGTGIVSPYVTPKTVQFYLGSHSQIKSSYDATLAQYPGNEDARKAYDQQIQMMIDDPAYEQFVLSSFGWSGLVWDIAKEIIGDKAVDLLGNVIGTQDVREAIKAVKNSDWASLIVNVGQVAFKNTPIGKALKLIEATSDMRNFLDKTKSLFDTINKWGATKLNRVWAIIDKAPKALKASPEYWKYVDDLTSPKFGVATTGDWTKTFDNAFPGVRVDMAIHHASPRNVLDRYPNLGISSYEMHSLENLRGIPNTLRHTKPDGSVISLHQHITNTWAAFYNANPSITNLNVIFDKAKSIDDQYGHLFVPPVR